MTSHKLIPRLFVEMRHRRSIHTTTCSYRGDGHGRSRLDRPGYVPKAALRTVEGTKPVTRDLLSYPHPAQLPVIGKQLKCAVDGISGSGYRPDRFSTTLSPLFVQSWP